MSLEQNFLEFLKTELRSNFSQECAQHCIDHKITRMRDLAFGWTEEELELSDELQFLAPLKAIAQVFCSRDAEKAAAMKVSFPSANTQVAVAPSAQVPGGLKPQAIKSLSCPDAVAGGTPNVELASSAEDSRSKKFAYKLLQIVFLLQGASTLWASYETLPTEPLRQSWKDMMVERLADYDYRGLQAALATWTSWSQWCLDNSSSNIVFSAVQSALFLKSRRSGGPTAARGVWGKLLFLQQHLGIPFDCKARLVLGQARLGAKHMVKVADALFPRDNVHLLAYALCENEVVALFSMCVLCMVFACLRFQHAQRSNLQDMRDNGCIIGLACKGKARRSGSAAPPCEWALPKLPFQLSAKFWHLWHRVLGGKVDFLIPGIKTSTEGSIWKAFGFTSRPMSRGQFNKMLASLLHRPLFQQWEARPTSSALGARSCRRVLPTIGTALKMPISDMFALGSWQDNPANDHEAGRSSAKCMPALYTSHKLDFQIIAKGKCANACFHALFPSICDRETFLPTFLSNCNFTNLQLEKDTGELSSQDSGLPKTLSGDVMPRLYVYMDMPQKTTAVSLSQSTQIAAGMQAESNQDQSLLVADAAAESSSHESTDSSSSGSLSPESEAIVWVIPKGSDVRLHRLGGCTIQRFAAQGKGPKAAMKQAPYATWCRKCALDLHLRFTAHLG